MLKYCISLLFIVGLPDLVSSAVPKIFLIRHAEVNLGKPGWGTTRDAAQYKKEYNFAPVKRFAPDKILEKIDDFELIDTIFCSPQSRATETTKSIFSDRVTLVTDSALAEFDYPVIRFPVLQLPVKTWLLLSRASWSLNLNNREGAFYKQRKEELEVFSHNLVRFANHHGMVVVVAHGMVNRELIKILKKNGWRLCSPGYACYENLSVNCLKKELN